MVKKQIIVSDKELWINFISGEKEAFRTIYEKYFTELFDYGSYFIEDNELVKDCIQDLFVNLYNYRSRLTVTDKIKPYLITSLRQIVLKKLRSLTDRKKRMVNIDSLPFDYSFVVDIREEDDDKIALLQDAMGKLTARQREAIYLKYVTGLSYSELSATMNLSYQASRNLIYHSMEKLREIISDKVLIFLSILYKMPLTCKKN